MAIVAGFDVHRSQITFDALDTETGEVHRGRIPADPASVRAWVGRFPSQRVDVAVEACTGCSPGRVTTAALLALRGRPVGL
jgi:transposase